MNQVMKKILLSAVSAPSGDNAQPWVFNVGPQQINLFLQSECDNSLYNYQQQAAYLALGAVIENISIAAVEQRLKTEIALFPSQDTPDLAANINLIETDIACSSLFPAIEQRATHRGK